MSYPTDRIQLFDRNMSPLREISPSELLSRIRCEEINGEHELVLVTSRRLEVGWRALTVDATGRWREWVVAEPDEAHDSGLNALGTYHLVWSLQYDLTEHYCHTEAEVGSDASTTAQSAAALVLEGLSSWSAGPCDSATIPAGTSIVFIYESAWSRLSKLVSATGCEVDSLIEVSPIGGVLSRQLVLTAHVGSSEVTRRFDWGEDVTGIRRTPDPGPYYCRVVPLGRGTTEYARDDETSFDWPLDITDEEPHGLYYLEDAQAAAAFAYVDESGTVHYPTKAVTYSEDDPELLLAAAREDLLNHTRPGVTYEANVVQLAEAGMDVQGVSLGDDVQVVDRGFNPDAALRIQGRVMRVEIDELSPATGTQLTIGQLSEDIGKSLADSLDMLNARTVNMTRAIAHIDSAAYLRDLVDRLNAEINATGGYCYYVPGEGFISYDVEVADPLIGVEASRVTQMKGGSIRIAASKKSGFRGINDWNWKTVFTAGHIAADVVTAAYITSGYIGSGSGKVYFDLDNNELHCDKLVSTDTTGDIANYTATIRRKSISSHNFYGITCENSAFADGAVTLAAAINSTKNMYTRSQLYSKHGVTLRAINSFLYVWDEEIRFQASNAAGTSTSGPGLSFLGTDASSYSYQVSLGFDDTFRIGCGSASAAIRFDNNVPSFSALKTSGSLSVSGNAYVSGTKSRLVGTDHYGDRLLYCYESASPLFGDVGSSTVGDDGYAYVSIDDVFSEATRTDLAYQVFLQACGPGKLWVEEKSPAYFVVRGTPGLSFDWEVKGRQVGYSLDRLEPYGVVEASENVSESLVTPVVDAHGGWGAESRALEELLAEDLADPLADDMTGLYREEIESIHA